MKVGPASKYVKIYIWQGVAFLLRFLSMFIVMPYLSANTSIYGIYAACVSVTIFLSYADMGFLKASQKYAAECLVRDERHEEMRFIGFGTFMLLVFSLICTLYFFYLALDPSSLIKGLDTPEKLSTASGLLFVLALFTPVTVLQRMISIIFDIRLDTHIYQKVSVGASIITVCSVFYFFGEGKYEILPYFIFSQSINLFFVVTCFWVARKRYDYRLLQLFRCIRFNSSIYKRSHSLAYSGLYVMFVWILFYELDQLSIAGLLGVNNVAIYAIAFTFATLFRSIFSILFSPFSVRANHFVGNGDDDGLRRFFLELVTLSAPFVVLATAGFALIAKPLILTWVGPSYIDSVNSARLLGLVYTFSFISYPASMILVAKERVREIYWISTLLPIIFWSGVFSTVSFLGVISFAIFKLVSVVISEGVYLRILLKYLRVSSHEFSTRIFRPLLLPVVFLVVVNLFAGQYLPHDKSRLHMLVVLLLGGATILCAGVLHYVGSPYFRNSLHAAFDLPVDSEAVFFYRKIKKLIAGTFS